MMTYDDFVNPYFDVQRPVIRQLRSRTGYGKEEVVEGVTTTNNFNQVGYTYHLSDGELLINIWHEGKNKRMYKGIVLTYEEFDKKLKYVDLKIKKLNSPVA